MKHLSQLMAAHRYGGKKRGQSLVEFALVLPVLLLFIMGTIDFGRALFTYAQVTSQMRQALRLAAVIGYDTTPIPPYLDCDRMRDTARNVFFADSINMNIMYLRVKSSPTSWTGTDFTEPTTAPALCADTGGADVGPSDVTNGDVLRIREQVAIQMITPLFPQLLTFTLQGQRTIVTNVALASVQYCGDLVCSPATGETSANCADCATGGSNAPWKVDWVGLSDGSIVSSPYTIQIDARDIDAGDGPGLLHVSVSINGGAYQAATYSGSGTIYNLAWTPANGVYTLVAQAVDNNTPTAHTSTSTTIHVTVSTNTPPVIDSVDPANGTYVLPSTARQIIVMAHDAEDAAGTLNVAITVTAGTLTSAVSWNGSAYVIDWTTPGSGTATINITVTDSGGQIAATTSTVTVGACGGNCPPSPVTINNPTDGATVSTTVTIQIDAQDAETGAGLLTVQVSIDGGAFQNATPVGAPSTIYTFGWDTTGLMNGPGHTLVAKATDGGGLSTNSSIVTVTIANPVNTAPNPVTIAAPANGSTVSGLITIQVDAQDAETGPGLLTVQVSIDGGAFQNATYSGSGTIYNLSWDTTLVSNGAHTLQAKAIDGGGLSTTSSSISVNVSNAVNTAPNPVTITNPTNGATVNGVVTVTVNAVDAETAPASLIVQVSIDGGAYQNATYTGAGNNYTYSWNTTGLSGSHTIIARATDTGAPPLTTTSSTITVTIGSAPTTMHVGAITIDYTWPGSGDWTGFIIITVVDNQGNPVSGVTVTGNWMAGVPSSTGRSSCLAPTNASGQCTIQIGGIPWNKALTFTMLANFGFPAGTITGGTLTYIAGDNAVNTVAWGPPTVPK